MKTCVCVCESLTHACPNFPERGPESHCMSPFVCVYSTTSALCGGNDTETDRGINKNYWVK